jgi:hypothetical protein
MSGGIRNVYVDNCVFLGTDEGLRFKSARGRGGVVENLYYNNVSMRGIATDAIGFTMSYGGASPTDDEAAPATAGPVPAADETTPAFRKIHFKDITCVGAKRAVHLVGLPELPIAGVDFTNVTISADAGFDTVFAKEIHLSNVRVMPMRGPVFKLADSADISLDRAWGPKGDKLLVVSGAKSGNIRVQGEGADETRRDATFENGATAAALIK